MKTMLKPMLAMGVVMVSLLITATSCDKKPAAGNSGGSSSTSGSGRTGDLRLVASSSAGSIVKIKDNNTILISAGGLASRIVPLSDADDADRSFDDIIEDRKTVHMFNVIYPGALAAMIFVNRGHVTKDNIALRYFNDCSDDGENEDNTYAKAAGGGTCRLFTSNGGRILFYNGLGTVFNNTKTTSHARGMMTCNSSIYRQDNRTDEYSIISDTLVFNSDYNAYCYIGVVNNGLGTSVEINDAWVGDSGSTAEVELYALAVDVTGKTIPEFSSAPGFNRREFVKTLDNAAFKKILEKNYWADLKFKVKIVTAATF